jgi:sulfate adenylyltransferase subunit 2
VPDISEDLLVNRVGDQGQPISWGTEAFFEALQVKGDANTKRTAERTIVADGLLPAPLSFEDIRDEAGRPLKVAPAAELADIARRKRILSLVVQQHETPSGRHLIACNDGRNGRSWVFLSGPKPDDAELMAAFHALAAGAENKQVGFWPHGPLTARVRALADSENRLDGLAVALAAYNPVFDLDSFRACMPTMVRRSDAMTHLDRLEAESIHIMREVAANADNPVMLYSVGKDSAVMLHLARKAFYPSRPPFPLLHVDTRWKFQEMYLFRDQMAKESGMELLVHINPEGIAKNINPFDHGSALHTDIMKTEGLKQALAEHKFDVAFGGARRDEEKSRAKERVFSFRTTAQRWDPKNQRPELWNLYNTRKKQGESIRVFPISNWTELDVWQYIYRERIPIVPLYFAAVRPVVIRDGLTMLLDDDRLKLMEGEQVEFRKVRFRTLGCYPLTGGFDSDADDLASIILELLQARSSERQGRAIDTDSAGSMEKKKQEGYF